MAMNITLQTTNLEATPAITQYVTSKLQGLEKLIEKEASARADIEIGRPSMHHKSGVIFRAEINLSVGKTRLRAVCERDDLYAAIDGMRDEIIEEYRSHKDKKISGIKKGGSKIKKIIRGLGDEASES
jgi:ribosomal subunit interface protein